MPYLIIKNLRDIFIGSLQKNNLCVSAIPIQYKYYYTTALCVVLYMFDTCKELFPQAFDLMKEIIIKVY